MDATKEVASYKVTKGNTLVIDAQENVNYQLINDATGLGPQNIIAKRDGNDLQITLENGDLQPDIIIKNYYGENTEDTTNLIVGEHENGNIYAYVPESGETADAVSMLAAGDIEPQALGGHEVSALWVFSPWWLVGLGALALAGVAIGASGGSGKKSSGGNVVATPETSAEDLVKAAEAAEKAAEDALAQAMQDGVITPEERAKIEALNGKVNEAKDAAQEAINNLPNGAEKDKLQDRLDDVEPAELPTDLSPVTNPSNNGNQVDTLKPVVTPSDKDGSVEITPAEDDVKVEIGYTDEEDKPQTVVVEKDPETGEWKPAEGTELPEGVTVDPETGAVTIDQDAVKDNSPVTAEGTDKDGNTAETEATADEDDTLTPEVTPSDKDGSVKITPAEDDVKVEIGYTDEEDKPQTVVVEKDPETGEWKPAEGTELPEGVTVDPETGAVTINQDSVKDDSPVTAEGTDKDGNTAETEATAGEDDTLTPVVTPSDKDGSVVITPAEDDVKVEIGYTDEEDKPQTVVVEKDLETGEWKPAEGTELPEGVTVDPETGAVTIDQDAVKDNSPVTAE
ncbi:hypothetical protein BMT54_02720, partial [Pasteurellaceae bacterium 15-036681]